MPQSTSAALRSRSSRPSPPPPGVLFGPGECLEGLEILDEIHGGPGVALWQALRSVTLWAARPAGQRTGLFRVGSPEKWSGALAQALPPAPLRALLRPISRLLTAPGTVRSDEVARACRRISRWAEKRDALGTALAFAQAAALSSPTSAPAALETGVLAERRGHAARAEAWLRRAAALARREVDRTSQAHAYLHLARLLEQRGDAPGADRLHERALRAARRGALRNAWTEDGRMRPFGPGLPACDGGLPPETHPRHSTGLTLPTRPVAGVPGKAFPLRSFS